MEENMKITIEVDEKTGKIDTNFDKPVRMDDFMTVLFTVQLEMMKNSLAHAQKSDLTEDQINLIRDDMYDKYNAGASNVLYLFAPDNELHPDLTVEAMKAAEDQYMYNQLNRKTRREIDKKTKGETKILRFDKK